MGAIVTTVRSSLNFGGVEEGSFGPDITPVDTLPSFNGGIEIKEAPEDGLMTVRMEGDADHFAIHDVYIMEWAEETVDAGELPPGFHGRLPTTEVLEVVNFSDGTTPVEVLQGQFVLIRVSYAAGFIPGTFNANVVIEADTWETLAIPVSLFISDVKTIPSGILNIAQGGKASLPFSIQSIAGPEVDVHFEMSPTQLDTGLILTPNNFNLQPTEEKTILLEFTADTNAPIGSEEVALDQWAFRRKGFFFTANIMHAQITVNPLIPPLISVQKRGDIISIPISVQLNNGPAVDIRFFSDSLPADVSIGAIGSFPVGFDTTVSVDLFIGNAVTDEFNFLLQWNASWDQAGAMNFNVVITEPEVITLNVPVVTDENDAVSGWVEMILQSNGSYTFHGSMRATGLPSYNYGLQVFVKAANGIILTAFHSGNIYGTDTPGNRDDVFEENLSNGLIKAEWISIRNNPVLQYQFNASMGGILGTLWDFLQVGLEALVAFMVAGPTGAGIVLGNELLSAANITPPPGIVAGIAVMEGTILVFGTGAIIPAIVAGAATGVVLEAAIKTRPIHDDEKEFARKLFDNVLDEKFNEGKVWITNLTKPDNVKFTIPVADGIILLNLGDGEAYDDPVHYAETDPEYIQKGSVFAHELTHACQIAVNKFVPFMICNAPGTYDYASNPQWAQLSWRDFTREQQAHIVDDWYGAFCQNVDDLQTLEQNLNTQQALAHPAFKFITQCRGGIF